MSNRVQILLAALAGLAVGAGLVLVRGAGAERRVEAPEPVASPVQIAAASRHELLDEVAEHVRREYVDPVPPGALEQAAVEGLVESLDPHSTFLDAAE